VEYPTVPIALRRTRAEFLCVLGDDDRWRSEKIETQIELFDRLDEACAVVYTWGVVRKHGRLVRTRRPT